MEINKKRTFLFGILILFSLSLISAWNFQSTGVTIDSSVTNTTVFNYTINGSELPHNNLSSIQGGDTNEYYHLNESVYNYLLGNIFDWITSTGGEPLWEANYSDFLTIKAWNDTGLIRDWNVSGWIRNQTTAETNWNSTSFIVNWSEIISSTDYNTTGLIRDWNVSGWIRNQTTGETNWNSSGLIRSYDANDWNSTGYIQNWSYLTGTDFNATGLIRDWNVSGWIRNQTLAETNWNSSGYLINWSNIDDWNLTGLIQNWNTTGYIQDWNSSGLISDWSGIYRELTNLTFVGNINVTGNSTFNENLLPQTTLTSDIGSGEKRWNYLYVANISSEYIDAYGLIASENVSADYFVGSGKFLTDLPISAEIDPKWTANFTLSEDTWLNTTNLSYLLIDQWNATNSSYLMVDRFNVTNSSYREVYNLTFVGNITSDLDFCIDGGNCLSAIASVEKDPYWTANVTDWNASWLNTTNITYNGYNSTSLIRDWNDTTLIIDWNSTGYIQNWSYLTGTDFNATGLIRDWNVSGWIRNQTLTETNWNSTGYLINWSNIDDWNLTGLIQDWNASGYIRDWALAETDSKAYNGTLAYNQTLTDMWTIWANTTNTTYNGYNSTGLIRDWNVSGWIRNQTLAETNWNATGLIRSYDVNDWNSTGYIKDWAYLDGNSSFNQTLTDLLYLPIDTIYGNTSVQIWDTIDNGTLAYNQTLTDIWSDILNGADLNATGLIRDWNISGWIRNQTIAETNWNSSSYIVNWSQIISSTDYNSTGLIRDWNVSGWIRNQTIAETNWNSSGLIRDWNTTGYIRDWGVSDWNSSGLIRDWNVSSLIINWSLIPTTESDPMWTANITNYFTKAQWNVTNSSYLMIDRFNVTNASYLTQWNTSIMKIWQWNATNSSYLMVDRFNVTNTTYRTGVNNTITSNMSLTSTSAMITNGTANGGYIYHNGTGWLIKG